MSHEPEATPPATTNAMLPVRKAASQQWHIIRTWLKWLQFPAYVFGLEIVSVIVISIVFTVTQHDNGVISPDWWLNVTKVITDGWSLLLLNLVLTIIETYLIFAVGTAMHESGHFLAAILVGYVPYELAIGPLVLSYQERHLRLTRQQKGWYYGHIRYWSRGWRGLRWRSIVVYAAGSLVTFILCLAAGAVSIELLLPILLATGVSTPQTLLTANLSLCVIAFAGVCAISLLLSLKKSANVNDGTTIWRLLTKHDATMLSFLRLRFLSAMRRGERPRTWSKNAIDTALALEKDASQQATLFLFAYVWALDKQLIDQAAEYLDAFLKKSTALAPMTPIALEVAFFRAYYQHNTTEARTSLSEQKAEVDDILLARTLAAIAYEEHDFVETLAQAQKGLQALQDLHLWKRRKYCMEEEDLQALLTAASLAQ